MPIIDKPNTWPKAEKIDFGPSRHLEDPIPHVSGVSCASGTRGLVNLVGLTVLPWISVLVVWPPKPVAVPMAVTV